MEMTKTDRLPKLLYGHIELKRPVTTSLGAKERSDLDRNTAYAEF